MSDKGDGAMPPGAWTAAKVGALGALAAGVYAGMVFRLQPHLLYQARTYSAFDMELLYKGAAERYAQFFPGGMRELSFAIPANAVGGAAPALWKQKARLLPARDAARPRVSTKQVVKLWVVFGGNNMLAEDWLPFCSQLKLESTQTPSPRQHAFLLIDYCGFGDCEGEPSPAATLRASSEAFKLALAAESPDEIGVLGCSLGCAAALEFALHVTNDPAHLAPPVDSCVLLCPFTDILAVGRAHWLVPPGLPNAIARRLVRPECDWDNARALDRLAASKQRKGEAFQIDIVHGSADEICPVQMGRALHEQAQTLQRGGAPVQSRFHELAGVDHDSVILFGLETATRAML